MRCLRVALIAALPWGAGPAVACCAVTLTASRPAAFTSTVVIVADGANSGAVTLAITVQASRGWLAVLVPVPAGVTLRQVQPVDPSALDHLLTATAPRLLTDRDPDPCFPRPSGPPPAPVLVGDRLPQPVVHVDDALFAAPGPRIIAWLGARGLHPDAAVQADLARRGTAILALSARAERDGAFTLMPLRLQLAAPAQALAMLPDGGAVTLLTLADGAPAAPAGPVATEMPQGASVPEFVGDQLGHFYQALQLHQEQQHPGPFIEFSGPATVAADDLSALGAVPGMNVRRFRLNPPPGAPPLLLIPAAGTSVHTEFHARLAWKGRFTFACTAGYDYRRALAERWRHEAETLSALTGWDPDAIRRAMVAQWQRTKEPGS